MTKMNDVKSQKILSTIVNSNNIFTKPFKQYSQLIQLFDLYTKIE